VASLPAGIVEPAPDSRGRQVAAPADAGGRSSYRSRRRRARCHIGNRSRRGGQVQPDGTQLVTPDRETRCGRSTLAGNRLRRFPDAFGVEIHYDVRNGRAVFRAEISGEMLDQLTQQIHRAEVARSAHARARLHGDAKEDGVKVPG
jgi:hypothetical protein